MVVMVVDGLEVVSGHKEFIVFVMRICLFVCEEKGRKARDFRGS